jgi:hypothetical protein
MKASFVIFVFCGFLNCLTGTAKPYSPPEDEVMQTIQHLFEGMRKGDSTMVRSAFYKQARLLTVVTQDEAVLHEGSVNKFVEAVGTPHEEVWDERISDYEVNIDGDLASVWTPYTFYLGDQLLHCGVNAFQLFRSASGWKIIQITDTRRKTGCEE